MDLILDTSIIIEIFGGNERVHEHLKNQGNKDFGITTVLQEIRAGSRNYLAIDILAKDRHSKAV